jgi:N6-L-threonylcarbamoyladenine synthase
MKAARACAVKRMVVGGGVAANARLREKLTAAAVDSGLEAYFPPLGLCTDNAVMVAGLGCHHLKSGRTVGLDLDSIAQVERQ